MVPFELPKGSNIPMVLGCGARSWLWQNFGRTGHGAFETRSHMYLESPSDPEKKEGHDP